MEIDEPLMKCKCSKEFAINRIQKHIQQSSCKSLYSPEEYNNLVKQCDSHKKEKKKKREYERYHEKQSFKKVKVHFLLCYNVTFLQNLKNKISPILG